MRVNTILLKEISEKITSGLELPVEEIETAENKDTLHDELARLEEQKLIECLSIKRFGQKIVISVKKITLNGEEYLD